MFAATVNLTVPLPVPLAPAVTVIHESLLLAVHAQVLPVETLTAPEPPSFLNFASSGETEYEHGGGGGGVGGGVGGGGAGAGAAGAACETVNARPPIVKVPVRAAPVLAATLNPTEPFPVPLAPDVTVIHDALLLADHRQAACVDMPTLPVPPDAATF